MKQHRLGPNGAIMTSLNLFSTKFDQVSIYLIFVIATYTYSVHKFFLPGCADLHSNY